MSLPKRKEMQAGYSVVCDDCGQVFYVSHEITAGRESKKRCSRYIIIHSFSLTQGIMCAYLHLSRLPTV